MLASFLFTDEKILFTVITRQITDCAHIHQSIRKAWWQNVCARNYKAPFTRYNLLSNRLSNGFDTAVYTNIDNTDRRRITVYMISMCVAR